MDHKQVTCNRRIQMERQRRVLCKTGTPEFVAELKKRTFKNAEAILQPVKENLSIDFFKENGFSNPILIKKPDGLNMKTPSFEGWTRLEEYVGGSRMVEIINVVEQNYCIVPFSHMINHMKQKTRTNHWNMVSLECSATSLANMIQPPAVAKEMDWVTQYWSSGNRNADLCYQDRPRVQKYCLVSPVNAYTDFHIDFGGSSVWYHMVKGAKTFYLIRPTINNKYLYKNWIESTNRLETFFGDQVDDCYKVTMLPGNTLFLPTGWIHAVLTLEDSLVFGGNFLHSYNMEGQLEVYDLEVKRNTHPRFLYPYFEELHWRAARGLAKELEEMNTKSIAAPSYLLNGLKAVLKCLKQWITSPRSFLPINEKHFIIRNVTRHIKNAERLLITLNPPKPERGSTRPRKKRILDDFIDYPVTTSRKKFIKKPKQALGYLNENTTDEKWLVQNGGTKVVFRKLSGLQRKQANTESEFLEGQGFRAFPSISGPENNGLRDLNDNSTFMISDSDDSCEETWVPDQPGSSNPILESQNYTGSPLKVMYPINATQFNIASKKTDIDIKEKKVVSYNNESNKLVVVHQDDEYVYPSLLLSDDEIEGSRLSSKDKDMPWNPKAKVGNVVPRTDRPSRIGKQKLAVEKGLEEAAAVCDSSTQLSKVLNKSFNDKNAACKNFLNTAPVQKMSRSPLKNRRRYSTVKQRLSKILKLHRKHR